MKAKSYTLFLQTALSRTFIALLAENSCIDILQTYLDFKSDNTYVFNTQQLLQKNNLKPSDINTIFVLKGPGYFTGIRAGLVIAKAFCDTLQMAIGILSSFTYLRSCISTMEDCAILIAASRKEGYIAYFKGEQNVKEEIIHLKQIDAIKENWHIYSETPFLVETYGFTEIKPQAIISNDYKLVRNTKDIQPHYMRSVTDLFQTMP